MNPHNNDNILLIITQYPNHLVLMIIILILITIGIAKSKFNITLWIRIATHNLNNNSGWF